MLEKCSPFENMVLYSLNKDVTTCEEAASAKGIPLQNELKSLIIDTSIGLYLLNIPGDKLANLRSIKKAIKVKEAFLAGEDILSRLKVEAGTVTPLLSRIWNIPQLLSLDVLEYDFVSTNAGTHNKYIIFNPTILKSHPNTTTGYFSK